MTNGKNLLGQESSPYLLQHKNNPVWWHPWGEEAFARAESEDKPIFLSIGYSTCYWCHVMESDSFEQQSVADVLNEHFVCIKVDREELPDVDQIYMDVVVGIHGHGGWPMSVFLTSDRKPFWGGTFFYRDTFIAILRGVAEKWQKNNDNDNGRASVLAASSELMRYLESKHASRQYTLGTNAVTKEVLKFGVEQLLMRFDTQHGGFGGAPKFPAAQQLLFLMRAQAIQGDAATLSASNLTLSCMARGGIFDHVGGGFHRYAVDAEWLIPHFEKMLYDNALLVPVYLEAYQLTGTELYKAVAERTLDYMLRDMRDSAGGFYSAEDAGEVDKEGEFYAWKPEQIQALLGEELGARCCNLFGITEQGNFEHASSVLTISDPARWSESRDPAILKALEMLYAARLERKRPHRDTKVLTGWNGLAITALARGYQLLGDRRYLDGALEAATFICEHLWSKETLLRRFCVDSYGAGNAAIAAVLEDYAYLIEGFLALFQASSDELWLERAVRLQDEQDKRLWSAQHGAYISSAAEGLIVKVCEWSDGATPAPNGISLSNLTILAELTGESRFAARGERLERGVPQEVTTYPAQFCSTLRACMLRATGASVCVVISNEGGEEPPQEVRALWAHYLPFTALIWGQASPVDHQVSPVGQVRQSSAKLFAGRGAINGKPTFYLCKNESCLEPMVAVSAVVDVCSLAKISNGMVL
ncbi:MAG: thioredoxin domain-containing protein [Proteobacteria bacterium]|nr:thioredoxin domain-containing protein [Pseudomonadota bacterium]